MVETVAIERAGRVCEQHLYERNAAHPAVLAIAKLGGERLQLVVPIAYR